MIQGPLELNLSFQRRIRQFIDKTFTESLLCTRYYFRPYAFSRDHDRQNQKGDPYLHKCLAFYGAHWRQ